MTILESKCFDPASEIVLLLLGQEVTTHMLWPPGPFLFLEQTKPTPAPTYAFPCPLPGAPAPFLFEDGVLMAPLGGGPPPGPHFPWHLHPESQAAILVTVALDILNLINCHLP